MIIAVYFDHPSLVLLGECIAKSIKRAHDLAIEPRQIGDVRAGYDKRSRIQKTLGTKKGLKKDEVTYDHYYAEKGGEYENSQWKREETVELIA